MPFLTTTIAAETGHNTSANSAYNKTNFAANFTGTTWIAASTPQAVNSNLDDDSYNPITPAHVSPVSVKTLIPGFAGRWYAHLTPWFHSGGGGGHIDIGVNCNSDAWVDAMIGDVTARGFDGLIIDWHGDTNYIDLVTLRIQSRLAVLSSTLTFQIMMDPGAYTDLATLQTQLAYVETTYLGDSRYQLVGGLPIVSFFSTVAGVSNADYATAKAGMGVSTYWMMQNASSLAQTYVDACFDWSHADDTGVNPADPYKLAAVNNFLSTVHANAKGSMLCLTPGFDGYLTAIPPPGWSKGKYMPRDAGNCWISVAATLAANIPTHCIGIQLCTWDDWEEGTEVESAIDNELTLTGSISGNILTFGVSGGTGDQRTLSSFRFLATPDGVNAAVLGTQSPNGTGTFDLSTVVGYTPGTPYTIYVLAVGKACIRTKFITAGTFTPVGASGNARDDQEVTVAITLPDTSKVRGAQEVDIAITLPNTAKLRNAQEVDIAVTLPNTSFIRNGQEVVLIIIGKSRFPVTFVVT